MKQLWGFATARYRALEKNTPCAADRALRPIWAPNRGKRRAITPSNASTARRFTPNLPTRLLHIGYAELP